VPHNFPISDNVIFNAITLTISDGTFSKASTPVVPPGDNIGAGIYIGDICCGESLCGDENEDENVDDGETYEEVRDDDVGDKV
jgi:hypothetical protein